MRNGTQIGPLSEIEVRRLAKEGTLEYSELLWRPGMKKWVQSGNFNELFPPPATPIQSEHATHESNNSDQMANSDRRGPTGLGGWLILVATGLFLGPLWAIITIVLDLKSSTQGVTQAWYNLLLFEASGSFLVGMLFPVWLIISFFQHKKDFPGLYIYWAWSLVALHVVILVTITALIGGFDSYGYVSGAMDKTIGSVIGATTWTLYMKRSKRVANTFDIVSSERWQLITLNSLSLFLASFALFSFYLMLPTGHSPTYSDSSNRLVQQHEEVKTVADPYQEAKAAFQREDYATELQLLRPLAERGDPRAQAVIGIMYDWGLGVRQDYAEAAKWLRLGADQGYAEAQYNLGLMYEAGRGVPHDHAEAVKWWGAAAAQGFHPAK